ncbi:MAG TPA: tyrosine--tRNA ligase, partial [Firmicutes bacterium]|nr:tyrosine--tRNA ligase [Bacillota bacterium]
VERFLALYTFLPMDEVRRLGALKDQQINEAKKILAYEVTKLTHGEEEAKKAEQAAHALFSGVVNEQMVTAIELPQAELEKGFKIIDLVVFATLAATRSEAKRLLEQGGIALNDQKISDLNRTIEINDFNDGKLTLKKGKKDFQVIKLV